MFVAADNHPRGLPAENAVVRASSAREFTVKPGLQPGSSEAVEFEVAPEMCPHFDGVLVHPVCATWTLVQYMEVAGRRLLAPYLDQDEEGVGAHISVDHRAPAPIGSRVVVTAQVDSVGRRRLTCRVDAHGNGRRIASGRFVQVVVAKSRLERIMRPDA
jgi:fluoroacetyl-CoA thioesterase